ncbi:hypothetical protein EVG20_g4207 [Dentipellis fragilis]|uniref:Uncharacterized protein n=1 Tax=Dentipellis fragilis TaxID=205917 RepID=A0A4Y9YYQ0_9AGAM|nr:hypothetical protein EVG20_g4207 [Dentipellis fragilis]
MKIEGRRGPESSEAKALRLAPMSAGDKGDKCRGPEKSGQWRSTDRSNGDEHGTLILGNYNLDTLRMRDMDETEMRHWRESCGKEE